MELRSISPADIQNYLRSLPWWLRWREWMRGRRYIFAEFMDRPAPLVIIAHSFRDASSAARIRHVIEETWERVPAACREAYDAILRRAPRLVVIQLRRKNVCGCLGHRHVIVKEPPFTEPHEVLGATRVGEMDIAYERTETWQALPLSDLALDTKFLEGTRQEDFRSWQFDLKLLSIVLHETHHLVFPREPEGSVRARSIAFYHDALAAYAADAIDTMSFTIDRSFSRLG